MSRAVNRMLLLSFFRVARIPLLYTICCQRSSICKEREKKKITVKEINCKSFLYVLHIICYILHTHTNIIVLCCMYYVYAIRTYNTYFIYYICNYRLQNRDFSELHTIHPPMLGFFSSLLMEWIRFNTMEREMVLTAPARTNSSK